MGYKMREGCCFYREGWNGINKMRASSNVGYFRQ